MNNKNIYELKIDIYYKICRQIWEIIEYGSLNSIFEKIPKNRNNIENRERYFANRFRHRRIKWLYNKMNEADFSLEEKRKIITFCYKEKINPEGFKEFIKFLFPTKFEKIKNIDFKYDDFYEFREQILNLREVIEKDIDN